MKARYLMVRRVALSFAITVLLLLMGWGTMEAQTQSGSLQGMVTSPDGYPLPDGTVVRAFEPGTEHLHGQTAPNLEDGLFTLSVPDGTYALRAFPPEGSSYIPSAPRFASVSGAPVEVPTLALTYPQITGTVTGPDSSTPITAHVTVFNSSNLPVQRLAAPHGIFHVGGLPAGSYALWASPATDDPYWHSERHTVTLTSDSALSLTLPLTEADLWGVTQDAEGHPVAEAKVLAVRESGEHRADISSASGFWAIGGLPEGEYALGAMAPLNRSELTAPERRNVMVPNTGNPHTLTFTAPQKHLRGSVRTNTEAPVFHALVVATRTDRPGRLHTLTNEEGRYEIALTPGLWSVTVQPISDSVPARWVYPDRPQVVRFESNNEPETHELNLTVLTADSTVTGKIELPDGSTPPYTVTVHLHNDEGVGRRMMMQPDGTFQVPVPHGGYKVQVYPHHPGFLGPIIEPIRVPPTSTVDLGTLTLVPRDAIISGVIRFTDGCPAAGIPVTAWRAGGESALHTLSGTDGRYVLAVTAGTWQLRPAPGHELPVFYNGDSAQLTVEAGSTTTNINFELLKADAIIEGTLVDGEGNPVSEVEGWARAQHSQSPTIRQGAPIVNGTFRIRVPAGSYQLTAHLPPSSRYFSVANHSVTVRAGEVAQVRLLLQPRDATILGALRNVRDEARVVTGVRGAVGGWYSGNWAVSPINPETGLYRLNVAAGLWHLDFRIDPHAPWARVVGPRNIPVQSGQTVEVALPIVPKDSVVSGRVLDPEGAPLRGALVVAHGVGGDIERLTLETFSNEEGRFRLTLPHGNYRLGATIGRTEWIKPVERSVMLGPDGTSTDHELQFQEPTATLTGALLIDNAPGGGRGHVWAWSDEGGFARAIFTTTLEGSQATGTYRLRLVPGNWHVGAAFEESGQYWHGRLDVVVPDGVTTDQDITLTGPSTKPAPVAVTFDAGDSQRIELADGTSIYIPAGAIPVSGRVTLRIVPIATLPHQQRAQVVGYGYSFLATDENGESIEAHFSQEVVIRFSYAEADPAWDRSEEERLRPAYFSTTSNEWVFPVSYTVDTANNQITMQIDHFTDFAVVSDREAGALGHFLYLPVVVR